jgi:hypothetical protein
VFRSGTVDKACRRLMRNAAENGCPRITDPYYEFRRTDGTGIDAPNTWKPPT